MMDQFLDRLHHVARYAACVSGALILFVAFLITMEVLARRLFNVSLGGTDDWSGFILAIACAWGFGFALLERAHVRIDSVYVWLPIPVRAMLDIVGLTIFGLAMGVLAWQGTGVFVKSVAARTMTMSSVSTPVMYPQFLWIVGLYLFVVIAVCLLVRSLITLAKGDFLRVQMQLGSKSVAEELEAERADIERRQLREAQRRETLSSHGR